MGVKELMEQFEEKNGSVVLRLDEKTCSVEVTNLALSEIMFLIDQLLDKVCEGDSKRKETLLVALLATNIELNGGEK